MRTRLRARSANVSLQKAICSSVYGKVGACREAAFSNDSFVYDETQSLACFVGLSHSIFYMNKLFFYGQKAGIGKFSDRELMIVDFSISCALAQLPSTDSIRRGFRSDDSVTFV